MLNHFEIHSALELSHMTLLCCAALHLHLAARWQQTEKSFSFIKCQTQVLIINACVELAKTQLFVHKLT